MTDRGGRTPAGFSRMNLILLLVLGASTEGLARSVASPKKSFSLEDVLYNKFGSFNARWISAYELAYTDITTGDIIMYNMKDTKVLVKSSILQKYNCTSYRFSSDLTYLLMRYDDKANYRHSTISKYVAYSLKDGTYADLAEGSHLQHAEWIPGRNAVVYAKDNNLYYADVKKGSVTYTVTETGVPGLVFNGISDWVYEEEILGKGTAFSMSADGRQMVYLSIDDRGVTEAKFMTYGDPGSLKDQYTTQVSIPYPKPGTPIPKYQLRHFNFTSGKTTLLSTEFLEDGRAMVYDWKWVSNTSVAIVYANRVQNVTESDVCHLPGPCKKVFEDRNSKGWANFDVPLISETEDRYLVRLRQMVGKVEYYHVNLVYSNGSKVALTNGSFMVRGIVDWDQSSRYVYYVASEPNEPSTDHVYAVSESGREKPFCMTCQMKSPEGVACKSGTMKFNWDHRYVIGTCFGPSPTVVSVYSWSPPSKLTLLRELDIRSAMRQFLKERTEPNSMTLKVKVTDTMEAEVRLLLPPDMDTTGKTKYPLIVYVYGGPENPQVRDNFRFDWSLYLTTNRSVVYGVIDGRGSARTGTEMLYAVYRALGTAEIQDQITVTDYLKKNLKFIDPARIGIWGWSYGGYATTKVLEEDLSGVFKCGVAVAPVSDWIYYNSIYTERYMDLPANNPQGYRNGSLLYNVENLRSKQYLLIHGTGDDNVHYQHAMHLAKVLEKNNIIFEQESYPDEAHGISGALPHLYYTMERFWDRCFGWSETK